MPQALQRVPIRLGAIGVQREPAFDGRSLRLHRSSSCGDASVAERRAAQLARVVSQRLVHELEAPRNLVRRQMLRQVLAQRLLGNRLRRVHDRVDAVAQILVREPDDRARAHGGMGVEGGLDLGRIHVRAADENHVRLAIDQVQVAVLVEIAHVAEGLPAVGGRRRLGADVAVGGAPAARRQHEHLAHLAGRALAAVRPLDADLAPAGGAAHRARALEPLAARGERARDALGAAVGLEDLLGPDPLDPRALEPGGARGAGAHHAPQRREIEARCAPAPEAARCAASWWARRAPNRCGAARSARARAGRRIVFMITTVPPHSSCCQAVMKGPA